MRTSHISQKGVDSSQLRCLLLLPCLCIEGDIKTARCAIGQKLFSRRGSLAWLSNKPTATLFRMLQTLSLFPSMTCSFPHPIVAGALQREPLITCQVSDSSIEFSVLLARLTEQKEDEGTYVRRKEEKKEFGIDYEEKNNGNKSRTTSPEDPCARVPCLCAQLFGKRAKS